MCLTVCSGLLAQEASPNRSRIQGTDFSAAEEALIRAISAANSPATEGPDIITVFTDARWEIGETYQGLVNAVGATGLRKLRMHRWPTVALRAAWDEVALTVPEAEVIDLEKLLPPRSP